jgi:hypothetical protein
MPVQPATRRLLTEQAGVDRFVPLTQRGTANGVASLGADGKIPVGQMPQAAGVPLTAIVTAGDVAVSSATYADALTLTGLTAGLWRVTVTGAGNAATSVGLYGQIAAADGLVAANTGSPATAATSSWYSFTYGTSANAVTAGFSSWSGGAVTDVMLNNASASQLPFAGAIALRVTTGGTLKLRVRLSTGTGPGYLALGSQLAALKLA